MQNRDIEIVNYRTLAALKHAEIKRNQDKELANAKKKKEGEGLRAMTIKLQEIMQPFAHTKVLTRTAFDNNYPKELIDLALSWEEGRYFQGIANEIRNISSSNELVDVLHTLVTSVNEKHKNFVNNINLLTTERDTFLELAMAIEKLNDYLSRILSLNAEEQQSSYLINIQKLIHFEQESNNNIIEFKEKINHVEIEIQKLLDSIDSNNSKIKEVRQNPQSTEQAMRTFYETRTRTVYEEDCWSMGYKCHSGCRHQYEEAYQVEIEKMVTVPALSYAQKELISKINSEAVEINRKICELKVEIADYKKAILQCQAISENVREVLAYAIKNTQSDTNADVHDSMDVLILDKLRKIYVLLHELVSESDLIDTIAGLIPIKYVLQFTSDFEKNFGNKANALLLSSLLVSPGSNVQKNYHLLTVLLKFNYFEESFIKNFFANAFGGKLGEFDNVSLESLRFIFNESIRNSIHQKNILEFMKRDATPKEKINGLIAYSKMVEKSKKTSPSLFEAVVAPKKQKLIEKDKKAKERLEKLAQEKKLNVIDKRKRTKEVLSKLKSQAEEKQRKLAQKHKNSNKRLVEKKFKQIEKNRDLKTRSAKVLHRKTENYYNTLLVDLIKNLKNALQIYQKSGRLNKIGYFFNLKPKHFDFATDLQARLQELSVNNVTTAEKKYSQIFTFIQEAIYELSTRGSKRLMLNLANALNNHNSHRIQLDKVEDSGQDNSIPSGMTADIEMLQLNMSKLFS